MNDHHSIFPRFTIPFVTAGCLWVHVLILFCLDQEWVIERGLETIYQYRGSLTEFFWRRCPALHGLLRHKEEKKYNLNSFAHCNTIFNWQCAHNSIDVLLIELNILIICSIALFLRQQFYHTKAKENLSPYFAFNWKLRITDLLTGLLWNLHRGLQILNWNLNEFGRSLLRNDLFWWLRGKILLPEEFRE